MGISYIGEDEEGCQADIFYGGFVDLVAATGVDAGTILGNTMAHEIGHLLLGTNSHSPDGIMQARWNRSQLVAAQKGLLVFTQYRREQLRPSLQTMHPLRMGVVGLLAPSVLLVSSLAFAQSAALKAPDKTTIATLEKTIPGLMKEATVPGLSMALIRDGKTYWLHAFGVKNAKTGQLVTDDTTFEAASLSKPVFAYAVLKLVDQGKLDLNTSLINYLPKPYIEGDDRLSKITARSC